MHLNTTARKGRWAVRRAAIALAVVLCAVSAHAFEVTDTAGKHHRLADYRGKWVVVNFWATWCAPCIKEIPEIVEFQRANAPVVVIGIALDVEDADKVRQFAKKIGHAYPLVLEDDSIEPLFGKVKALPTTMMFNPEGKRVWNHAGTVTRKSLEEVLAGAARPRT